MYYFSKCGRTVDGIKDLRTKNILNWKKIEKTRRRREWLSYDLSIKLDLWQLNEIM